MAGIHERRDDELIAAAKRGDEQAWRTLHARLGGRLHGWLTIQSLRDAALDAEDLSSEAWLTASRRIAEFTGDTDAFAGWLFVIARNLAINVSRRSLRRRTIPTELDPRQLAGDAETVDESAVFDGTDWVRRLMEHLSEREREVVGLVDVAGLDLATAARLLGLSGPAARVAHHRAMKRLERVLAELDDSAQDPPPPD